MVEHSLDLDSGGEGSPQLLLPNFAGVGTWKKILAGEITLSEGGPVLKTYPTERSWAPKLSGCVGVLSNLLPNAKDKSLLLFWPPVWGEG